MLEARVKDYVSEIDQGVVELLVRDKNRTQIGLAKQNSFGRVSSMIGIDVTDMPKRVLAGNELPLVSLMAKKGGIQTLVNSALNKLHTEYQDEKIAGIWIDLLWLYCQFFAPLPGFESRYFNEERIDLIIQILTRKFDNKNAVKATKKKEDDNKNADSQPDLKPEKSKDADSPDEDAVLLDEPPQLQSNPSQAPLFSSEAEP